MFWRKKKIKCEHDWHELLSRTETVFYHTGYMVDSKNFDYTYIFCPICNTSEKISSSKWEIKKKAQEIKENYKAKL